jgi:hypothetical protein
MIGPQFPDEVESGISRRTLRQFAGISVGVFGLLFAFSWYRNHGHPTIAAWIAASFAAFIGLPGIVFPELIRPVFMAAMAITRPIGHVIGLIMLAIIYYGLLTPLAIVFRLMGRDNLARRRPNTASYWSAKPQQSDPRSYLRQYHQQ